MTTDQLIAIGHIPSLLAARASKLTLAGSMMAGACSECRGMTSDELRQYDALIEDAERLNEAIDRERQLSSAAGRLHEAPQFLHQRSLI